MAKDPAFLFYPSDFLTGTQFFSDDQRGKYILLLCIQHQQGHMDYEDMIKICKTHDKDIFKKFVKDSDGLFYNERLDNEKVKRSAYSKSRSENRKKKQTSETYVAHMVNVNEDVLSNKGIDNTINTEFQKIDPYRNIESLKTILLSDNFYIGQLCQKGLEEERIPKWIDAFNRRLGFMGNTLKQEREYRQHFANWIVKVPNYRTMNPDEYNPIKDSPVKEVEGLTKTERDLIDKYKL